LKTKITLTPDPENNWNVHVQVIVASHAEAIDLHDAYRADRALRNIIDAPVTVWNDAPERTQEEVVAAFRKAAAL
jgi:hypothetical protein